MRRHLITLVIPILTAGCTGLSFGEKTPGSDVYLQAGDIAVDDRTETSFVLQTATETASSAATSPAGLRCAAMMADPSSMSA